jgi:hypothetical protein
VSIRDQATLDLSANLDRDGDPVTFINPNGPVNFTVNAMIKRVDARLDPQTNQQFSEPVLAISVAIESLPKESGEPVYPDEGWQVEFSDVTGKAFTRWISQAVRHDRMLGYVTFICEAFTDND